MKKVFLLALCLPLMAFATVTPDYTNAEWVPGRLLVNFKESAGDVQNKASERGAVTMGVAAVDALLEHYAVREIQRVVDDVTLSRIDFPPDFARLVILYCPEDTDVLAMMNEFAANPYVLYAEPDLLKPVLDVIPNDPSWGSQWDKRLMSLPRAWEFSTGSEEIKVVAIDVGTCWNHSDLRDNLWVNTGEDLDGDQDPYNFDDYPGDTDDLNGVDDDGDTKIDDFIGWDFVQNIGGCAPGEDCDSFQDNDPVSTDDHGTHVLGLMAARGNNGLGVAGVNWNVTAMSSRSGYVRASDGLGLIIQSAAVACATWAVANDVDIINMSFGSGSSSPSEQTMCQSAWDNGVLLCGASGNDGVSSPHYPAAYAPVVAVGSVDDNDIISDFSNYGTWLECFAPGGGVQSTVCSGGYGNLPGTSMASPNAAGVFALIWSIFPDLTNQELKDLVLNNCVDISALNPEYNPTHLGHGRVDAAQTLASVLPYIEMDDVTIDGDNDNDGRLEAGESGDLILDFSNDAEWSAGTNVQMTLSTTDPNLTISNATFTAGTINPGANGSTASDPFEISASASVGDAYTAMLDVHITGDNGLDMHQGISLRIGRADILLVDDDNGQIYSSFFESALANNEGRTFNYDLWSTPLDGDLGYSDIEEYEHIVWACGNETVNTLSLTDMLALASFLDDGNDLMLCGRGIDDDPIVIANPFYANYLHAITGAASGSSQLAGVSGDVISDGDTLLLIGGGCGGNGQAANQNVVNPLNGGVTFFRYTTGSTSAAVRFEGDYKMAYFAFALEAACGSVNTVHHREIIADVMDWFGAEFTDVDDEGVAAVPQQISLHGNYPNPFNPSTTISFDLSAQSFVQLRVYDLLGREVAELVNGTLPAGSHTQNFDGTNLPSGLYLVNLSSGGFSETKRMLLLK